MTESSISNLFKALEDLVSISKHLDSKLRSIEKTHPDELFKQIKAKIGFFEKPITTKRPPGHERYLLLWRDYLSGRITELITPALKYLCWESGVVLSSEFYQYIINHENQISARSIKGLLTTIHMEWQRDLHSEPIVRYTSNLVSGFSGRDRTINKWKTAISMFLGKDGAAYFARDVLLASLLDIKSAAEQWALLEHSAYMRYAVVNAAMQSLEKIGSHSDVTNYVLNELLYWNGWEVKPDGFRFIVSKLILHKNASSILEELRTKILGHPMLGDPRLPANKNKWLGVDPKATETFSGWLARRDIVFFFDHVLKGRDRHGRREFWLRYVNRMVSSRPFLSDSTAFEFRNNREVNYGKLISSSNQAAFILNFGEVLAVEFSDVGMIYIYEQSEFNNLIVDIWTSVHISETTLKNQELPDERKIRHRALEDIVNVDWRDKAASVLSKYGVRP